ncbi:MAG TPA: hypothetical protein VGW38_16285 [Chloroflexota bacterium]|nr:hypothetical protein [Chloroflexota bacterium]
MTRGWAIALAVCSLSVLLVAAALPPWQAAAIGQPVPAPTSAPLPSPLAPLAGSRRSCPVTEPNGDMPPGAGSLSYIGGYGSDVLWTNLWMGDEGRVVFEPGGLGSSYQMGRWG